MKSDAGEAVGQFKKPDLAVGPLKELNDYLHSIHREALQPSATRIARHWDAGAKEGKYRSSRSTSAVHAMFTTSAVPDGSALIELVDVLLTGFPSGASPDHVLRVQGRARRLFREVVHPESRGSMVGDLRTTGTEYFALADAIEKAERAEEFRRGKGVWARALYDARELLGDDSAVVKELEARHRRDTSGR
ncbi:hypothetical protein ACIQZO_06080 [Streptomyces sp. NPDC097617]|uniref:hypothetical protein n=1 Tax=Streptomyces sp. NPDC097617 TaxID=3366091 RepID=UPI00380C1A1F